MKISRDLLYETSENMFSCQLVRSVAKWSIGVRNDESSILCAYYNIIENAKHYILIQNQFFISKAYSSKEKKKKRVKNK